MIVRGKGGLGPILGMFSTLCLLFSFCVVERLRGFWVVVFVMRVVVSSSEIRVIER